MSCQKPPVGLSEDTKIRGSPRKEPELRGAPVLQQQRRLKQATQFIHKDSADLLPLDQLRRLGTSKDLQPHTVVQRRLLGGSPIKESSSLAQRLHPGTPTSTPVKKTDEGSSPALNSDNQSVPNNTANNTPGAPDGHSLRIACKVCAQDVCSRLSVEHRENLVSRSCLQRLGLRPTADPSCRVTLDIEVGEERLTSSAVIVDDDSSELSLGLDTLMRLKCCIDLEHRVLRTPTQSIPFLSVQSEAEEHSTTTTHPGEP